MSGINRWSQCPSDEQIHEDPEGEYVLHSDHEAEMARLRAMAQEQGVKDGNEITRLRDEVEGLRDVLAPFAEYERVRSKMGGTSPKSGQLFGVHSSAGSAELSVEDFKAAITAMGASA